MPLDLDEYLKVGTQTPAPLHGDRPPNVEINHEKAEHRLMVQAGLEIQQRAKAPRGPGRVSPL